MVRVSIGSASFGLLASAALASAASLPSRRATSQVLSGSFSSSSLSRVGTLLAMDGSAASSDVGNVNDIRYTTTVNLNGKDVVVALDTGSTDLWVIPPGGVGTFNDTQIPLSLAYGDGTYGSEGTIGIAPFKWGNYQVAQQAFMNAVKSNIGSLTDIGVYGIFGLGFNTPGASLINDAIKQKFGQDATWGNSVLENIFSQNKSTPNFVAIDLARTQDLEEIDGGSFLIGEYDPKFTAVQNSPKVEVFPDTTHRWTILLEGIEVNGKALDLSNHAYPGAPTPNGKLNALLDTGAPTVGLPKALWDAIYSSFNGSAFIPDIGLWLVPCKESIDLQVQFGSTKYPIHALDLTVPQWVAVGTQNYTVCSSTFTPFNALTEFDVIFGDPFLRNTYSVYDFGDFTDNTGTSIGKPYIQLLAETDPTKVQQELVDARTKTLSTMNPEIAPQDLLKLVEQQNGGANTNPNPNNLSALNDDVGTGFSDLLDGKFGDFKKYIWVVIGLLSANFVIGAVLVAMGLYSCISKRGKRGSPTTVNILGSGQQKYQPIKGDGYHD